MLADEELYACADCRTFDPDNQRSVLERLEAGWDPIVWTIRSGMTLGVPGVGDIPLHTQIVACAQHEPLLIAERGHDGGTPR